MSSNATTTGVNAYTGPQDHRMYTRPEHQSRPEDPERLAGRQLQELQSARHPVHPESRQVPSTERRYSHNGPSGIDAVAAAAALQHAASQAAASEVRPAGSGQTPASSSAGTLLQTLIGDDRCMLCRARRKDCVVETSKYGRPKACQSCGKSKTRCSLVRRDDEDPMPSKSPSILPSQVPKIVPAPTGQVTTAVLADPSPISVPASLPSPGGHSSASRSPAARPSISIAELPVFDDRPPVQPASAQDLLGRTLSLMREICLAVFTCDPLSSPYATVFTPAQAVGVGINTLLKRIEDLQRAQASIEEVDERTEALVTGMRLALARALHSGSATPEDELDELEEPAKKRIKTDHEA